MAKANAYEIIMSQIATGREVCKNDEFTGATVSVSLPGSPKAQVIRVENEGDTLILEEIVEEGKSARTFTMTADNAMAYHYVGNYNPKAVVDAEITSDGKFMVDEKEVFLGNLDPVEVLTSIRGFVLLLFENPDGDGYVIGTYDVQKDVFNICMNGQYDNPFEDKDDFTSYLSATTKDGVTYILAQAEREVTKKDDDGNDVIITVVDRPVLFDVYEGYGSEPVLNAVSIMNTDGKVEDFSLVEGGSSVAYVVKFNSVMKDGELQNAPLTTEVLNFCGDRLLSVEGNASAYMNAGEITAKTTKKMIMYYKGSITEVDTPNDEMAGFNYYAGRYVKTDEDDHAAVTYYYADAAQNVKSFTMTETDRGTLVKFN